MGRSKVAHGDEESDKGSGDGYIFMLSKPVFHTAHGHDIGHVQYERRHKIESEPEWQWTVTTNTTETGEVEGSETRRKQLCQY